MPLITALTGAVYLQKAQHPNKYSISTCRAVTEPFCKVRCSHFAAPVLPAGVSK